MRILVLYVIFFISGFCGLCYEVIWGKEFHLILGHTTYAVSAVLTAFMAGLALGSYLIGKKADGAYSSMRLYAILELGIGFCGLFFMRAIELYKQIYIFMFPYISGPSSEFAFKFVSSLLMIIIPTTLMGATFPVMAKIIIDNVESRGYSVGLIYFLNSVGGAFGCIFCGFYMLFEFGTEYSISIVCSLNIFCGLAVLLLKRYFAGGPSSVYAPVKRDRPPEQDNNDKNTAGTGAIFNPIFALFMVSGFISMLLEITWTRFLILIMGSSTYSFSIMLFTFILFLAFGSLLISRRVDSISDPVLAFAVCELIVGAYALLTIPFYENLPLLFIRMTSLGQSYFLCQSVNFVICIIVMAPAAMAFGATFPLAVKAVKMDLSNDGGMIGKLYSFNTVGCILGSLLTGIVILPRLGFRMTLNLGITLAISAAVSAVLFSGRSSASSVRGKLVVTISALCAVTLFIMPDWDHKLLNIGSFYRLRGATYETIKNLISNYKVLFYRESISATVYVVESESKNINLKINGKTDGSTERTDMITQRFTAILPMMRVKSPKNVLIIGMGTGTTLAAVCRFPEPEKITCVEIIPEVVEAASYFREGYEVYCRDPRVSIIINDARSFLLTARENFDVIISEPSNPWIAGIGSLFTTDFFRLCRSRLNPDGCMLAWIQAYESSEFVFKLVLRTYLDVFPDSTLWFNTVRDVYALSGIGGKSPAVHDDIPKYFADLNSRPGVKDIFRKTNITDEVTFSTMFLMTNEQLRAYAGDGPRNTDNFQIIEYEAPKLLFHDNLVQMNYRYYAENLSRSIEKARAKYSSVEFSGMLFNAVDFLGVEFYEGDIVISLLDMILAINPADHRARSVKGAVCARKNDFYLACREFDYSVSLAPDNLNYLKSRAEAAYLIARGRMKNSATEYILRSIADWKRIAESDPGSADPLFNLAMAYRLDEDHEKMIAAMMKAVALEKDSAVRDTMLLKCAISLIEMQKIREAIDIYRMALRLNPNNAEYINFKIGECENLLNYSKLSEGGADR